MSYESDGKKYTRHSGTESSYDGNWWRQTLYIVLCIFAFLITPFTLFPSLTGDSVFENYLPIEQPTILEELQNILSKYPDGAQILRVSSQ